MTSAGQVRVLGMGNVLTGDDAFGPYVVRVLTARYEAPPGVEIYDIGTPGLDLTPHLASARAVIVVDTVASATAPGTIRIYRQEELLAAPPLPRTNPHEPGLREALMATELSDCSPDEIVLIGTIPVHTETMTGLSPPVRSAVDEAIAAVCSELDRLGCPLVTRSAPLQPDIWWE